MVLIFAMLCYAVSSTFYLVNIFSLQYLLLGAKKLKKAYILWIPYFFASCLMVKYRNGEYPLLFLIAVLTYYFLLIFITVFKSSIPKRKAAYVALLYLTINSIFQSLGSILTGLFLQEFDHVLVFMISSLIFNLVAFFIIKTLIQKNKNDIQNSIRMLSGKTYLLILISMLSIGILCGSMASESSEQFFDNKINSTLTALTSFFFVVVIVYMTFNNISKKYYENISYVMEKQVNEQIEYYKKIDKMTGELREFRHDYKNHILCLQALLEKEEYSDALTYVKGITRQDIIEFNKFYSGNQIADALLSDKSETAEKNNIKIQFDGFISDELKPIELCTILSNALDNSIEACEKLHHDETKNIFIKCAVIQGIQIIEIKNPNPVDSITTKTTKTDKENHGFGLYHIRRTVEAMGGKINIPSMKPEFVLELEFPIHSEHKKKGLLQ